jgi:tRNA(His) 5'-end guanylyltransferase
MTVVEGTEVPLEEEMYAHEHAARNIIEPENEYAIFRYDGCNFGKYTKNLDAPEDAQFMSDMDAAATKLVEKFSAVGAFVVSDEISLILKADINGEFVYGGNITKIASVGASVLSAALTTLRPNQDVALFDGRGRGAADADAVRGYLFWRQASGFKNAVGMTVKSLLTGGHKLSMGVNTIERISLLSEHGIKFTDATTDGFRNGRIVRKVNKMAVVTYTNKRTGVENTVEAVRSGRIAYNCPEIPSKGEPFNPEEFFTLNL